MIASYHPTLNQRHDSQIPGFLKEKHKAGVFTLMASLQSLFFLKSSDDFSLSWLTGSFHQDKDASAFADIKGTVIMNEYTTYSIY